MNYMIICSHIGVHENSVNIFLNEQKAINKILSIHGEHCDPHDDQYSYSDNFISHKQLINNPSLIDCKNCKFINDYLQVSDIDPDDTLDNGLYVDKTFKRTLCLQCDKEETLLLDDESDHCEYYYNIKTNEYKRKMCEKYLKFCYCEKCEIDLWEFTECVFDAKPGTMCNNCFRNDGKERVYIQVNVFDRKKEFDTSWDT